ncbi:sensor histidine kinase [Ferruginibacter paludis]|uniref:tetratricopeptide repeat-containing sensor histidine kinase n=1 Tax=Ferruginibacter paludis TaxID=1310417 RepID=UPI0025B48ACF|nr:sensor histidine kinase [Ferruginibacter paludis]MDN3655606.1 sensor histidine kinase [Ferruginibacter paludis]
MKCVLFTFFLFLSAIPAVVRSQQYNKDSIQNIINNIRKQPVDTSNLRQLRELGHTLFDEDSALSKQILDESLAKSITLGDRDAITNSYRMLGLWYSNFNFKDKAMELHQASLNSAKINHHLYLMAGAYFNMGNIKYWKGQYDSCIDYYLKTAALYDDPKIFEDKSLQQKMVEKRKSDVYCNMSAVFNTLKNLPKADEYIDKALAIAERQQNNAAFAFYIQQKADNYFENGQAEKALRTRQKYLPQMEQGILPKTFLQGAYQNIAQDYLVLGKTDSSKIFATKSLETATGLRIPDGVAASNWLLGRIALKEKQFSVAESYLDKSRAYLLESENPTDKRDYYDVMRQLMFAEGKYKEAYAFFENYIAANDSIMNGERTRQFNEREARYQSEKKDDQIKIQQASIAQKNTINYLLGGAALALLTIGMLMVRNYRHQQTIQQQRINDLETEKQLTATEAVLKGEEQERTRLAKDLHDGLGGMLSGIKYSMNTVKGNLIMTPDNAQAFERSMDMLDSSIKEMRRVAHNLMPEALVKFGLDTALKDFCNDINLSGALKVNYQSIGLEAAVIDQTTSITIYRVIQELINNAIKHAAATQAIVQLSKSNERLSVTVEDNGKGFDPSILKNAKGIGWSNIESRIDFMKGKVDIQSAPGDGTSVLIELPV